MAVKRGIAIGSRVTSSGSDKRATSSPAATAEEREQQTLGQQLSDEPRPLRAERGADRELFLAPNGSGQLQAHDVRNCDEKDEEHGGGQREQRRTELACRFVLHRHDQCADRGVLVGIGFLHSLVDLVELRHGSVHADVRTNAREHSQMMTGPARPRLIGVAERAPDLRSR